MNDYEEALPELFAPSGCDAELIGWSLPAGPRLTVVGKIGFELHEGPLKTLLPAVDLCRADRFDTKTGLFAAASDLAPLVPSAEILVLARAYGPPGPVAVRLHVARKGATLLDKRVSIAAGASACLGPVAPSSPSRLGRLKGLTPAALEAPPLGLPAGFDFAYFRAAPDDQQLGALKGDEEITLEGLHPTLPRLSFKLPGCVLIARLLQPKGRPLKMTPLLPDRLLLDLERGWGALTYRAGIAIDWATLLGHSVELGLAQGDTTVAFPDKKDPATSRGHSRRRAAALAPAAQAPSPAAPTEADPALPFPSSARPVVPAPHPVARREPTDLSDETVDIASLRAGRPVAPPAPLPVAPPAPLPVAPPAPLPVAPPAPLPVAPVSPPPVSASSPPQHGFDDGPLFATMAVDSGQLTELPIPFAEALEAGEREGPATRRGLPFDLGAAAPPPALDDAQASERSTLDVPTVTDAALSLTTFPWQIDPPKDVLVVLVKGTFDLVADGPATLRAEPALPLDDLFAGDDVEGALEHASDFAVYKPEVDVLLEGTAYAPGGRATAMQASLRVHGEHGSVDRAIAVFGDRSWQGGALAVPSSPEPFEKIPITYARAFGGPTLPANRQGLGHGARPGPDGARRLPNLEAPDALITSPNDTPAPASLSGIHPLSSSRARLLGTLDTLHRRTRWPYYPADFDHGYAQAAPPSQRLARANGDESYELVGVHPAHGSVRGQLAGVCARAFAKRTKAAGGDFTEIALRLDTITFSPDDNAAHLLWRGLIPISDDDAPELEHVFATTEPLAGPKASVEAMHARYLAAIAEPSFAPDAPPAPEAETAEGPSADDEQDEALAREIERRVAEREAEVRAVDPAAEGERADAPLPPPDPQALASILREAGAEEADIAEVVASLRPATEPPPAPDEDKRALVMRLLAEGEPLSGLDLSGADLHDLDLSAHDLEGTDLSGVKLDGADLTGSVLSRATLAGATLHDAKLEHAIFIETDFTGADLSGAKLPGALLDRVEARGLKAPGVDLSNAMLAGVVFGDSDLSGACLDGADLCEADLTGAQLERATFRRAHLASARLYDVRGADSIFDGADLRNLRAEGAWLERASFKEVTGDDSVWERARLAGSSFFRASLRESSFLKARCEDANFSESDLTSARLQKARLSAATLLRANLMEAKLDRAVLDRADLRGANLHAASLHRTSLKDTKLDGALTTSSDLDRRQG
ncbi:MAG: DUF2169 domain-containing protein [Polyangiaceae bacterium]|nr:DUF2169 domain-containing protein [Polyangiaceae bacterium]